VGDVGDGPELALMQDLALDLAVVADGAGIEGRAPTLASATMRPSFTAVSNSGWTAIQLSMVRGEYAEEFGPARRWSRRAGR